MARNRHLNVGQKLGYVASPRDSNPCYRRERISAPEYGREPAAVESTTVRSCPRAAAASRIQGGTSFSAGQTLVR